MLNEQVMRKKHVLGHACGTDSIIKSGQNDTETSMLIAFLMIHFFLGHAQNALKAPVKSEQGHTAS